MEFLKKVFGTLPDGRDVFLYTLKAGAMTLSLSTLGATWTSLTVPSRSHGVDDVLLGFHSFDGYTNNTSYFGATVGRFANRISGAEFCLQGKKYRLSENKTGYSLHGGRLGFSRLLWKAEPYYENDGVFVRFELESPDGDQGFPGNLRAAVSYGLTASNELVAVYEAKVDALCPVNLTNHAYFNLAGEGRGQDVLSTELELNCSFFVEVDDSLIPTGRILPTAGTPLDFRRSRSIGRDIWPLLESGAGGYDHCLVVDGEQGCLRKFGKASDPVTGRTMQCFTTSPGVQLYTGNMLGKTAGKTGDVYGKHHGFCLETQYFPDSPNQPGFPCAVFGPERNYSEKTVFAFGW